MSLEIFPGHPHIDTFLLEASHDSLETVTAAYESHRTPSGSFDRETILPASWNPLPINDVGKYLAFFSFSQCST